MTFVAMGALSAVFSTTFGCNQIKMLHFVVNPVYYDGFSHTYLYNKHGTVH